MSGVDAAAIVEGVAAVVGDETTDGDLHPQNQFHLGL